MILTHSNLQVVDKNSAIIEESQRIGSETDHRNMQRLPSREDQDYRDILQWINKWAKKAKEEADGKCR